ncbi:basic salivary proline-rich protein 2-like [Numida meleagris]|uniref:basic salivary proline-rich protein 2-like n=1 Tax=Numida meleagris TaxID=8996 RepID=UPI000B3DA5E7|nr:basic salivary proline-rich protein 2-like [Numida meleagris]
MSVSRSSAARVLSEAARTSGSLTTLPTPRENGWNSSTGDTAGGPLSSGCHRHDARVQRSHGPGGHGAAPHLGALHCNKSALPHGNAGVRALRDVETEEGAAEESPGGSPGSALPPPARRGEATATGSEALRGGILRAPIAELRLCRRFQLSQPENSVPPRGSGRPVTRGRRDAALRDAARAGSGRPSRAAARSAPGSATVRAPTLVYLLRGARTLTPALPQIPRPPPPPRAPDAPRQPIRAAAGRAGGGRLSNRSRGKAASPPPPLGLRTPPLIGRGPCPSPQAPAFRLTRAEECPQRPAPASRRCVCEAPIGHRPAAQSPSRQRRPRLPPHAPVPTTGNTPPRRGRPEAPPPPIGPRRCRSAEVPPPPDRARPNPPLALF